MGGGEFGVMCRKLSGVEKIDCIFSIFSVKNSTNLSAKNFGGVYRWKNLCWDSV